MPWAPTAPIEDRLVPRLMPKYQFFCMLVRRILLVYSHTWRRGRVVEGAPLLRDYLVRLVP